MEKGRIISKTAPYLGPVIIPVEERKISSSTAMARLQGGRVISLLDEERRLKKESLQSRRISQRG